MRFDDRPNENAINQCERKIEIRLEDESVKKERKKKERGEGEGYQIIEPFSSNLRYFPQDYADPSVFASRATTGETFSNPNKLDFLTLVHLPSPLHPPQTRNKRGGGMNDKEKREEKERKKRRGKEGEKNVERQ